MTPEERTAILAGRLCPRCRHGLRLKAPAPCPFVGCMSASQREYVMTSSRRSRPIRRVQVDLRGSVFSHLPDELSTIWVWVDDRQDRPERNVTR